MAKIPAGKVRELAPDGTHNFTCVQFLDLGTQPSNNPEFKPSRRCQVGLELTGQKTEEGDPIVVYKEYGYSSSRKSSFMKDLAKWFSMKHEQLEDLDPTDILQKSGLVTIEHKEAKSSGNTYANVTSLTAAPGVKGMKVGKHTSPLVSLVLDPAEFDQAQFDALPEWLRTKIAASPEYADAVAAGMKKENGKAAAKAGKKK